MRYYRLLPNLSARWNGWRDRRRVYPNDDTPVIKLKNVAYGPGSEDWEEDEVECASQYEVRVCNHAHSVIDKIRQQWQEQDGKLAADHDNALRKLDAATKKRDEAKEKYDVFAKQVAGDPTQHHVSRWAYGLLVSILGLAEFAMNMQVFTVFGAPQYETLLMALILSFSFPVAGHYLGRILRERPISKPMMAVTGFFLIVVISAVYYMSRLRGAFLTLAAEVGGQEFVHYSWLFFLFLNLLVLVISTLASYYVHEEDEKTYKRRRALAKAAKDYEKAEAEQRRAMDAVAALEGRRDQLVSHYQREADALANRGQELISIYRTTNSRRKTPPPKSFALHPDIKVPRFRPQDFARRLASKM